MFDVAQMSCYRLVNRNIPPGEAKRLRQLCRIVFRALLLQLCMANQLRKT
jgi:hypothetical protein